MRLIHSAALPARRHVYYNFSTIYSIDSRLEPSELVSSRSDSEDFSQLQCSLIILERLTHFRHACQWLPWDEGTCQVAAEGGHLAVLQWLHACQRLPVG
jgi:hypothetical protein